MAGMQQQYDDQGSVQICKFGWGAAAMLAADLDGGYLPRVVRMGEWFARRLRRDGSWAPSAFMTPYPGLLDLYWKTDEHVMELSYDEQALTVGAAVVDIGGGGQAGSGVPAARGPGPRR
jgi:hypothetical protein